MDAKIERVKRKLNFNCTYDDYYYLVQYRDKFVIPNQIKNSNQDGVVKILTSYGWQDGKILIKDGI